jgi:hypothetical protein
LWKFNTVPRTEQGADTRGKLADNSASAARIVGSYDPDPDLTYWGSRAADARQPEHHQFRQRVHQFDRGAAADGTSPGITSTRPASRSTSTKCSSASRRHRRSESRVHDRRPEFSEARSPRRQVSGYKETLFQNVFESFDQKTGAPQHRADILEQQTGQWADLPEHGRRPTGRR